MTYIVIYGGQLTCRLSKLILHLSQGYPQEGIDMKTCRLCLVEQDEDGFYVRYNTKSGRDTVCKSCHKKRVAENKKKTAPYKTVSVPYRAVPHWLTVEDVKQIASLYEQAKHLSQSTGIPMVVDHVIPLRGSNVSGLHVPTNLRIITAKENNIKSNTYPQAMDTQD